MPPKPFLANVTREGRWWVINVPAIDYTTQARTLGDVDRMARDLIGTALDVDPASVELEIVREDSAG